MSKSFGGISAVEEASIRVHDWEIVGLIGPNGAGKTTLIVLISGFTPADSGAVHLDTENVSGLSPERRARLGLSRSFQGAELIPSLTVLETLELAFDSELDTRDPVAAALGLPEVAWAEKRVALRAREVAGTFGLEAYLDVRGEELSTGVRRLLDVACAVALSPKVLLLDEPTSGLARGEIPQLEHLILRVREAIGCGIVVVEHDLGVVRAICDRVIAMETGRVIADGPTDEVLESAELVQAYVGARTRAVA